jgi:hypothetical protein
MKKSLADSKIFAGIVLSIMLVFGVSTWWLCKKLFRGRPEGDPWQVWLGLYRSSPLSRDYEKYNS